MAKFAVGPCQEVSAWLQMPWLSPELDVGWACDAGCVDKPVGVGTRPGVPEVGKGMGVLVGGAVGLGGLVGGIVVAVGNAACVSATIV